MADYSNCVSTNFMDWNVEKDFFKFCLKLMGFERSFESVRIEKYVRVRSQTTRCLSHKITLYYIV